MARGIYDDPTRHQVSSVNNRRAFKTPSVEKFALFPLAHEFDELESGYWFGVVFEVES